MQIHIAKTDSEISACYPAMNELRPHIAKEEFISVVRKQEENGYRLAFVQSPEGIVAVAGFRVSENMAWGRYLYVDDLVTLTAYRSKGYGSKLLDWLCKYAEKEGCNHVHLDSGSQRKDAHRFYEREGMQSVGLHFMMKVAPNKALQPTANAAAEL